MELFDLDAVQRRVFFLFDRRGLEAEEARAARRGADAQPQTTAAEVWERPLSLSLSSSSLPPQLSLAPRGDVSSSLSAAARLCHPGITAPNSTGFSPH